MGYYTEFSMKLYNAKPGYHPINRVTLEPVDKVTTKKITEYLAKKVFNMSIDEEDREDMKRYDNALDWLFGESYKWYSFENDMRNISIMFPDIIFVVDGIGEDREDIWQAVFRDGEKSKEYAEIIMPEIPLKNFMDLENNDI